MIEEVSVASAVGRTLVARGIDTVFGIIGSGNYEVTAALRADGARFIAARHESAAVSMADAYHRTTGKVAAVSVHQGPGFTNTLTALGEASKSHVPLIVVAGAASATSRRSNFRADQVALAQAVGAGAEVISSAEFAVVDAARAHQRALEEQRPVVINLPIDVQEHLTSYSQEAVPAPRVNPLSVPRRESLSLAAVQLKRARRTVIVAGRGAWESGARESLERLAERIDATLMTSAMALGMFRDNPRDLGVCGGFSSAEGVAALEGADLILAVGTSLTTWTTRGGTIPVSGTRLIRIDASPSTIDTGSGLATESFLIGDACATVSALLKHPALRPQNRDECGSCEIGCDSPFDGQLEEDGEGETATTPSAAEEASAEAEAQARAQAAADAAAAAIAHGLDGADVTARLNAIIPAERTLVVDGGHFIGWPVQGIEVPDPSGFVFSSAGFQSVGLGMGSAVGAAIARPDRLTVLGVGDGGYQMGISELETMVRLALPILVVVYNDAAYGAEVHHFGADDPFADQVKFPVVDVAAAAAGAGALSATIRSLADLDCVASWLRDLRGPLVLDVRLDPSIVGSWAEQDFLRH